LPTVGGSLRVLRLPPPLKLPVLALLPAIFIVRSSTICQSVYHSLTGLCEIISLSSLGVRHLLTFHIVTTTKTGRHDIAEILLKVALKHQKSINQSYTKFLVLENAN
jgi:hypothetical protein